MPIHAEDIVQDRLSPTALVSEIWIKLQERYADRKFRSRPPTDLRSDPGWDENLHRHLHLEWPCPIAAEFWPVWHDVLAEMALAGFSPGPETFQTYNDGDAGFLRTAWCLIRHLRAERVVETGVAHGLSSRMMLEALQRNGRGHLWSIDLPPLSGALQNEVGIAVSNAFRKQWTYVAGSSRRCLPPLLSELGSIDLFLHDSLHSERNVRFELEQAQTAVRPGGAILVDDVDVNGAFEHFTETFPGFHSLICDAEPVRPDLRRFNSRGLFGIILKTPAARTASAGFPVLRKHMS